DDDRNDGLYYSHSCPFLTDHKYFREGDSTAVQAPLQAFSNESVADLIFAGFIEILDTAISSLPQFYVVAVAKEIPMRRLKLLICSFLFSAIVAFATLYDTAQTQLPADLIDKIDKVATDALTRTGVPSASIA